MAYGAGAVGLPRELPVVGAIVESGLHTLTIPDADSVGYFQTRASVWNRGEYAGFPAHPELQLKWLTDQATIIRRAQLAALVATIRAAAVDAGANLTIRKRTVRITG